MSYLFVFIGGGIGAALRHGVNRASAGLLGIAFPYGTLIVNVLGSFLMGMMAVVFLTRVGGDPSLRLFVTTGMLGGFTTFSAFSLEAAQMWQRGDWLPLGLYGVGSILLSVVALFGGMAVARSFV